MLGQILRERSMRVRRPRSLFISTVVLSIAMFGVVMHVQTAAANERSMYLDAVGCAAKEKVL